MAAHAHFHISDAHIRAPQGGSVCYLSRAIVRVDAVDENRGLGHGDRGLLVPVRGNGGAHLKITAEVGAVAVLVLHHLLYLAVVCGLAVHVDTAL
jgi:hypothetical protein